MFVVSIDQTGTELKGEYDPNKNYLIYTARYNDPHPALNYNNSTPFSIMTLFFYELEEFMKM